MCPDGSHDACVSVNTTTSIGKGQDVERSESTTLRANTTYFITVVAESDELHYYSGDSDHIIVTTQKWEQMHTHVATH